MVIVWPSFVNCLRFPSFLSLLKRRVSSYLLNLQDNSSVLGLLLSRRVSSYLRPELHRFAILENSTLRLDWTLFSSGFPVLDQSCALSFLRPFEAIGLSVEELVETSETKFIVGFDFATILFTPSCSCIFFAVVLVQLVKQKFWAQQSKLKWLMLKHMKKIIPLNTCEIPSCQYVCQLVFSVDRLDKNFGSRLVLATNQSSATLWFLHTCLIVGLRPLIILNHGFVILNNVQHRVKSRNFRVRRDMVTIAQFKIVVPGWNLGLVLGVLVWRGVTRRVSSYLIFGVVEFVWKRMKHLKNQIPKIKSLDSIHAQARIEWNNVSFCWTVWNFGLFLAHPTCWHERVTSENAQESTWCSFWVF